MAHAHLNFHHLRYFWAVAREGNLTRAARELRVSPSALSAQIRELEEHLGQRLFAREGRGLVITESGRVALEYAETIFAAGSELVSTLTEGRRREQLLRVGAVATLSRNFQRSFVRPLLRRDRFRLRLSSGSLEELLEQLAGHELDVVLSNRAAPAAPGQQLRSRRLARQSVSLVSARRLEGFRFPDDVSRHPVVLPGPASQIRTDFDAFCDRHGVRLRVLAEVDDMATMRLLARDSEALVLVPSVVVRDELREGAVHEVCVLDDLEETFFAITAVRRFQHPLLRALLGREEAELLEPGRAAAPHSTREDRRGDAKGDGESHRRDRRRPHRRNSAPTNEPPAAAPPRARRGRGLARQPGDDDTRGR